VHSAQVVRCASRRARAWPERVVHARGEQVTDLLALRQPSLQLA
jgi:hypothetical protein